MMGFWDGPWVLPSSQSRLTGEDAERFEAGRPIVLGFFEVCRLAERRRRLDAGVLGCGVMHVIQRKKR